jgi:hypothetical protein
VLAWGAALLFLLVCFGCYLVRAYWSIVFPFGLDYVDGEVWRQAKLIPGRSMYGDIDHYPWVAFEYPPLYYLVANFVGHFTPNFLVAGRLVSCGATLISVVLIAWLTWQGARTERTHYVPAFVVPAFVVPAIAAMAASLMAFTLVPVTIFSVFVRVDMLGAMFSLTGLALAVAALRRPGLLYAAVFACVAAVFTKQTFIAAPLAIVLVWGQRDPWHTLRASAAGLITGLAAVAWLSWQTDGGFLRHIFLYNINHWTLRNFLALSFYVAQHCAIALVLTAVAVALQWRALVTRSHLTGARDLIRRLRDDHVLALTTLLTVYLVFAFALTVLAGKNGATANYYVEPLYACCIWIGLLAPVQFRGLARLAPDQRWRRGVLAITLPALLVFSAWTLPADFAGRIAFLYGPTMREDAALLGAIRGIDKPVLSDDLAMVMIAGKDAPIEPFVFAELARAGVWDENQLVDMLRRHAFGAVITYRDPGNRTFDMRFLPRTTAAILANYPRVISYGDSRLRLPK